MVLKHTESHTFQISHMERARYGSARCVTSGHGFDALTIVVTIAGTMIQHKSTVSVSWYSMKRITEGRGG